MRLAIEIELDLDKDMLKDPETCKPSFKQAANIVEHVASDLHLRKAFDPIEGGDRARIRDQNGNGIGSWRVV